LLPFWLVPFWLVPFCCADALRAATTNDTPAPIIIFEAARKLRRDLITMFLDDISVFPLCGVVEFPYLLIETSPALPWKSRVAPCFKV
jgi:hypothetical protein